MIAVAIFFVLLLLFLYYRRTVRDMQAAVEAEARALHDRLMVYWTRPTRSTAHLGSCWPGPRAELLSRLEVN